MPAHWVGSVDSHTTDRKKDQGGLGNFTTDPATYITPPNKTRPKDREKAQASTLKLWIIEYTFAE